MFALKFINKYFTYHQIDLISNDVINNIMMLSSLTLENEEGLINSELRIIIKKRIVPLIGSCLFFPSDFFSVYIYVPFYKIIQNFIHLDLFY